MTGDSLTPEQPPSGPLCARQSDETPKVGTQRGEGGATGPQTGAESRDPRLRAYAAVFAYIQQLPAEVTYLDPVTRNAVIWRAVHAALDVTDLESDQPTPAVRDREFEQLRARVLRTVDLIAACAPWTANLEDTAARVRDTVGPQENPPGSLREQLPDDVLATLSPYPYLSTACETGRRVDAATIRHPENADLPAWVERLHARCRLNHKFTGDPCNCRCHRPTAQPETKEQS